MDSREHTRKLPAPGPTALGLATLHLIKKIHRVVVRHGVAGTCGLCTVMLRHLCVRLLPALSEASSDGSQHGDAFDRRWGVNTSGNLVPDPAGVVGPNWLHGARYEGVDPAALAQVLAGLDIRHDAFTFLDLGSGKGRAVLVAARFPFKKVLGVEYSTELNAIAQANLSLFPATEKNCTDIALHCADAAQWPIPDGPLVLFLFNPFDGEVMSAVAKNLAASYRAQPRRIFVIYFNAQAHHAWKNAGFLREVRHSRAYSLFQANPHDPQEPECGC